MFKIALYNYHPLLKLSKIQIFIFKNKLVYRVQTAISNTEKYELTKLTPLPVSTFTSYFIYINLFNKLMSISEDKLDFTYVTPENCVVLHNIYYCEIINPIVRLKENSCTNNILISDKDRDCKQEYFSLNHHYVSKLSTKNTWYIVPVEKINLEITYRRQEILEIFTEPSLLSLDSHCIANFGNALLIPVNNIDNTKILQHKILYNHSELETLYFKEYQQKAIKLTSHLNLNEIEQNAEDLEGIIDRYENDLQISRSKTFTYYSMSSLQILSWASLAALTFIFCIDSVI